MKRKIITFIFLLSITAGYSQKEIYFSSSKEDSISISSLKYPEIEIASNFNEYGLSTSFNAGYFYEIKLTKKTALLTGLNVINSIYSYYPDLNNLNDMKRKYGLQLGVRAEPRWYIDYKSRVINAKNSKLNTSWYLGLPTTLATNYISLGSDFNFNMTSSFVAGFRYAFSEKLFIDTSAGFGIYTDFELITPIPYFKLKLGYSL
jgi:hypothetical protein